jgi:hypothetical protein
MTAGRWIPVALLLAACAATPGTPRPPEGPPDPAAEAVAAARARDDAALRDAAADLAPLESHYVAVADGRLLGGAMLVEDAARLLLSAPGGLAHAYFFTRGTEGDDRATVPALYGPCILGDLLLEDIGVEAAEFDAAAGTLVLSRGGARRTFRVGERGATVVLSVEPASGLGARRAVEFLFAKEFGRTALLSRDAAAAAGLERSEIPGRVDVVEAMSGRQVPCRRALARLSLEGEAPGGPPLAAGIVEVLFPR